MGRGEGEGEGREGKREREREGESHCMKLHQGAYRLPFEELVYAGPWLHTTVDTGITMYHTMEYVACACSVCIAKQWDIATYLKFYYSLHCSTKLKLTYKSIKLTLFVM